MDLICRTCLAYEDELEPLFNKKLVDSEYKEITAMILLCTGLKISEDDKLTNTICSQCIESTIAAFKYRKKVWESNSVLLDTTKVLYDEAGTNIDFFTMNTKTEPKIECFDEETLEYDFLEVYEEPNDTGLISSEKATIEIEEVTSENYKRNKKSLRNANKFSTIQSYNIIEPDLSLSDLSERRYMKFEPIDESPIDEHVEASVNEKCYKITNNYLELDENSTTVHPYETIEPNSPASDHSIIGDVQNYIELGPNDKSSIDKLIATTSDNYNSYKHMDKYIKIDENATTMRPYICTLCNQTYEMVGPLRKHLFTNHDIRVTQAYRCSDCSKTFINKRYFKRHLTEAHVPEILIQKNYVCDLCGKGFKFQSGMLEHINRHKGIKKFKCEICEFRTVSSSELKVHLRSHTGEKPYVCHLCGIGYKCSSHRGAHIKEAHSDGRPYECVICSKTYKSRRVYVSHMQIHNPKQNIKCNICNREFNYRKNLKVHMRQHGEKTFKCSVCEKAFYQKQNCQTHMKKVHNVKM